MVKAVSVYILVTAYTGAIVVAAIDLAVGKAIPDAVTALISSALGLALPALGLAHGVTLVNTDTAAAIKSLAAKESGAARAEAKVTAITSEGA